MLRIFLCFIISFFISTLALFFLIPYFRKINVKQPILKYVETHKSKEGTPTMGGVLFIIPSILTSLIFSQGNNNIYYFVLSIGFAYMLVGFIDDFIKLKYKNNQGLKPYQKIIFQLSIAIICGIFSIKNNLTSFYLPFTKRYIYFGNFTFFFVIFIFLAITNSVNLTDGIDGLASSVSIVYLLFLFILMYFQNKLQVYNFSFLFKIIFSLIGGLLGFLIFNLNKASIFMGDTGSLSLGGFIGALSIFSLNSLIIPILGIMFMFSSISVIIQVLHFKKTKERIFLMAPFHHHLQMRGLSECKICYIYSLITLFMGLILLLIFL